MKDIDIHIEKNIHLQKEKYMSDYFEDYINEYWNGVFGNKIHGILLNDPLSDQNWSLLGYKLIRAFSKGSGDVGLYIDGTLYNVSALLAWLDEIANTPESLGGVELLRVNASVHSSIGRPNIFNLNWVTIQSNHTALWLKTLWDSLDSSAFNVGCDLLLSFYPENIIKQKFGVFPEPTLDIRNFSKTLEFADFWLSPLDGNMGFVCGVNENAEKKLVSLF